MASHFGWKPKGTVIRDWKDNKTGDRVPIFGYDPVKCKDGQWIKDDNWCRTYFSNNWQEITANDAKNLAKALKKALIYISDRTADKIQQLNGYDDNIINNWSGIDGQAKIKNCIRLFKSGVCQIA